MPVLESLGDFNDWCVEVPIAWGGGSSWDTSNWLEEQIVIFSFSLIFL